MSASASARSISPWFRLKTGSGTETLVPTWSARSPDTWNSLCVGDVALARAGLAPAHGLAIVLGVLARRAQPLARLEERDEARTQLEGESPLEVRALGRRRRFAAARRREARAPLAREQDLLLQADLGHDRVPHADAARIGAAEGKVAHPRRERRGREQAGGDHA